MFEDYQQLVMQHYEKAKEQRQLSMNLTLPTAAKIKRECEGVAGRRFSRKDGRVLEAFFNQGDEKQAVLSAIRRSDPDRFKPLLKFLKKETGATDPKNIELLAWLIDFEDRPFDYARDYSQLVEAELLESEATSLQTTGAMVHFQSDSVPTASEPTASINAAVSVVGPSAKKPTRLQRYRALLLSSVAGAALAFLGLQMNQTGGTDQSPAYMYWAGDHYEVSTAVPKQGDTLLVPLDSARLFRFRKITDPGTITRNNIGQYTYLKQREGIEFFTDTGMHPVQTQKRLKPLTLYMYNKYVVPLKMKKRQDSAHVSPTASLRKAVLPAG